MPIRFVAKLFISDDETCYELSMVSDSSEFLRVLGDGAIQARTGAHAMMIMPMACFPVAGKGMTKGFVNCLCQRTGYGLL